jgi:hypothetical protein
VESKQESRGLAANRGARLFRQFPVRCRRQFCHAAGDARASAESAEMESGACYDAIFLAFVIGAGFANRALITS